MGTRQTTALDARNHLTDLEEERGLALAAGLADVSSYMADLDQELDTWRRLYVTAAVTEIATLRAELSGYQFG